MAEGKGLKINKINDLQGNVRYVWDYTGIANEASLAEYLPALFGVCFAHLESNISVAHLSQEPSLANWIDFLNLEKRGMAYFNTIPAIKQIFLYYHHEQ